MSFFEGAYGMEIFFQVMHNFATFLKSVYFSTFVPFLITMALYIRDTPFPKVLKLHLPDLCNHSLEHLKDFSS